MTGSLKLRLFLAAQLLFFAAWGGWLLSDCSSASPEFYLETMPVDPRDLVSGTYVALNYAIAAPGTCGALADGANWGTVYVKLEDRGRTANTPAGPARIYEASACAKAPADGVWARAEFSPGFGGSPRPVYGIERFYVNENDPLKDARAGSVIARVKLGRNNRLMLLGLEKKI